MGDLIWSELQVWQDRDRGGVTDGVRARTSGGCPRGVAELKSLSALGIIEISLTNTALNDVRAQSSGGRLNGVVTPQGAQLLSRGDVRFADGRVRSMFEGTRARPSGGRARGGAFSSNDNSAWRGATFILRAA